MKGLNFKFNDCVHCQCHMDPYFFVAGSSVFSGFFMVSDHIHRLIILLSSQIL